MVPIWVSKDNNGVLEYWGLWQIQGKVSNDFQCDVISHGPTSLAQKCATHMCLDRKSTKVWKNSIQRKYFLAIHVLFGVYE